MISNVTSSATVPGMYPETVIVTVAASAVSMTCLICFVKLLKPFLSKELIQVLIRMDLFSKDVRLTTLISVKQGT